MSTKDKNGDRRIGKRANNGGHSTKSLNPNDRRKNQFKDVMQDTVTRDELGQVFRMLYGEALDGNMSASKLLLEYSTVKPTAQVELTANLSAGINFKDLIGFGIDETVTIDITDESKEDERE